MSNFRKLTKDNDWIFGNGFQDYATGDEAIELDVKTSLQGWTNNCWFSLDDGIDYNLIFAGGNTSLILKNSAEKIISEVPGVASITSLTVSKKDGILEMKVVYKTIYGKELSFIL